MKKLLVTVFLWGSCVSAVANDLVITAVFDGPLTGGLPKGIEVLALNDIADLSDYGLGSANNGGGSDGEEFTFPAIAAAAGDYLYLSTESTGFSSFFGFAPDFTSSAASINGDDAIELFFQGSVIDLFGDIDVDGTGEVWEYQDGWAIRSGPFVGPSSSFDPSEWTFSGANALDGTSDNSEAGILIGLATPDGFEPPVVLPELRLISEIQGSPSTYGSNRFGDTDVSPLIGEEVLIEAIVVGDFQDGDSDSGRDLGGFFLQEETTDEDGDPLSSEGVFVFDNSFGVDVNRGDLVQVVGKVDQFFGETQIDNISRLVILEPAADPNLQRVTPALIDLAANSAVTVNQNGDYQPELESWEGMLVTMAGTLQVTEQFQLDRFNEVKLAAGDRPRQFTQDHAPSVAGLDGHLRDIGARSIVYDDGLNLQNVSIDNLDGFGPYFEETAPRMGDTVTMLSGVLDYKWAGNRASGGTWRVRAPVDGLNVFTSTLAGDSPNPRPLAAPDVGGFVRVASFNVLNFFTTLDDGSARTAVGLRPRGADDLSRFGVNPPTLEFDRQLSKLVNAIVEIDADIVGLIEIENEFDGNNDGSTAIEVLVNAVNERLGRPVYDYVDPGQRFVGSDAIAVAVIYRQGTVRLDRRATVALLDDSVAATLPAFANHDFVNDPIFNGPATNRVPLAVTFQGVGVGRFTVVVNHFKSKGSSGLGDSGSPNFDQGDGAGFWNDRRLNAAIAVDAWLETFPTGVRSPREVILGDLNAYAQEDPIQYLLAQGYESVEEPDAYSFVFDGQVGSLDYILVNRAMARKLVDARVWQINADEADALDYNVDFGRDRSYYNGATPTRNSDHDPLIAGFGGPRYIDFKDGAEDRSDDGNEAYRHDDHDEQDQDDEDVDDGEADDD